MGAPLNISDLITPLTQDQVFNTLVANLVTLGVPANTWRKGGAYRTILRVIALLYAGFTQTMASAIQAAFLPTASGVWLTLLAFYVFNVMRPAATAASGNVNITNSGGGVYGPFAPGQLQFLNATTKQVYANTSTVTLNPGDTGVPIAVACVVLGTVGNANPGDISALQTTLVGVTCTNPAAIVGQDEMSDADLRALCLAKLGTLNNGGPRSAYLYAVRVALNGGLPVNINRIQVSAFSSTGVVNVWLASPSGVPSSGDVAAAAASIEALARPDGVTVNVMAATAIPVATSLTLYSTGKGGVTAQQLHDAAANALTSAFSAYAVGGLTKPPSAQGYLFAAYVRGIAMAVDPTLYDVDDGGAADTALYAGQVAVDDTTVTVQIVPVTA